MQLGLRNEQPNEFAMFPLGLITKMFFFQFLLWSNLLVKLHLRVSTLLLHPFDIPYLDM